MGLAAGLVLFFAVYALISKEFKKLGISILSFTGGFGAVTLPVIVYFAVNHALTDLFTSYFYNNIFLYGSNTQASESNIIIQKFFNVLVGFGYIFRLNFALLILILIAVISFSTFSKKINALLITCFLTAVIPLYITGNIIFYYGYNLMAFLSIALVAFASLYEKIAEKISSYRLYSLLPPVIASVLAFIILMTGKNLPLIMTSYEDMPQYIFAQEINKTEDPRILTYDVMDLGFYTASNTLPVNKYFCFLNIEDSLPELLDEQHELIDAEYFDYIITESDEYEWDGYHIIKRAEYSYVFGTGDPVFYYLYLYGRDSI